MTRISGVIRHEKAGLALGMASGFVAQTPRYTIVFDGIIFNAEELGHADTDAELILSLVEQQGIKDVLSLLNADFALALYDKSEDVLWLARDRFGVLPLYYLRTGNLRAFGSQPSLVGKVADTTLILDENFIARFAGNHYRGIDQNLGASPYKNVRQVPPATVIRLDEDYEQHYCYWSLKEQPEWTTSEEEIAREYRSLILDAVKIRQRNAPKSAYTLSGGLDSSTILACVVNLTGKPQPAFSTVYDDATFDESAEIQPMLMKHVHPWQKVLVEQPDIFSLVAKMVELHDEPVVTATWLSHYLLVKAAQEAGYNTLWGGLGGDELNAGEYEYFMYYFADLKRAGAEAQLQKEIAAWIGHHNHPVWQKSAVLVERELQRLVELEQPGVCLPDTARLWQYQAALNSEWAAAAKANLPAIHPFKSYLKNRTYQDLTRETLPCCLRAEDRQTAAFGISRRLPFLDYRLVEFMWRVPGNLKIRDGVTKYLLRQAIKGILPEETRKRIKKTGWNAPAHKWFVGEYKDQLLDMIHSQTFRQRGIYNISAVEHLISEHTIIVESDLPKPNHMMFLWQLINLELWLAGQQRHRYTKSHVKENATT